jgi:large subunit ribosomal protein L9
MKIILLKDHDKLGGKGAIVEVADGFARNYLIPNRIAATATPGALKALEHDLAIRKRKEDKRDVELEKILDKIEGLSISFTRRATEDDRLYGAVSVSDILEAIAAKGFDLDKKHILLEEPIKALGVFPITVHLNPGKEAKIEVWVVKGETESN